MKEDYQNQFTWMPILNELGRALLGYEDQQLFLVKTLKECGVHAGLDDQDQGKSLELEEIDPFTFCSLILKHGKDTRRNELLGCIQKKLGLSSALPKDYSGVPKPNAMAAWLFAYKDKRNDGDIALLWQMARAMIDGTVDQDLWEKACNIHKNGVAKLSQAMFWFSPEKYLPVDAQTRPYLETKGINADVSDWNSYQALLGKVTEQIGLPFYQISRDAWQANQVNSTDTYIVTLTEGAVRNSYIPISRKCDIFEKVHYGGKDSDALGTEFSLLLPDGQTVRTDIRRASKLDSGRLRHRFSSLFPALGIKPGSIAEITKNSEGTYTLTFRNTESKAPTLPIDKELLALAVERTIRPLLFEKGWLQEGQPEGYQHHEVIPRAQPHLSRKSIESDAILAVSEAIKVAQNLLSQYELTRSLHFLKQCQQAEARVHFLDLLYGDDPLLDRIHHFLDWGDWKHHQLDGKPIGFNPTIVSYLLSMSQPGLYAFCKPENYKKAAQALLGVATVEQDTCKRIVHTTQFYQEVLQLFVEEHGLPFTDLMHVHIAFWVLKDSCEGCPSWDDLMQIDEKTERTNMKNLNTILYGPPGTGKTFRTARMAVQIIDGNASDDRAELMARYHQLADAGRIFFVTFHQSFSYEEFVEGIRPVLNQDDESGKVTYELSDGIFKQACQVAQGVGQAHAGSYVLKEGVGFWKISLGDTQNPEDAHIYDDCIEKGRIAVGFGGTIDISGCEDRDSIVAKLEQEGLTPVPNDFRPTSLNMFKNQIKIDDIVVVSDGNLKFRAIGRVAGKYQFDAEYVYSHLRNVEWLAIFDDSLPHSQLIENRFSQMTLYRLHERALKLDALKELLSPSQDASKETVLIIDEINRGNISKILGELITLLETDKRMGAINELRAHLPYSGEEFGIPSNLHVIGTMNTADRSLALIDTALRRRFVFSEVAPQAELLGLITLESAEINLTAMLNTMNQRIEALFNRNHRIGHAYFMNDGRVIDGAELPQVFQHRVIPLLTEYFFEDWSKVRTVLGDDQSDEHPELCFVREVQISHSLMPNNAHRRNKVVYELNESALRNPAAYLKIYANNEQSESD